MQVGCQEKRSEPGTAMYTKKPIFQKKYTIYFATFPNLMRITSN